MCPKFVYNIKIGLAPESGNIYYCATWLKPFWLNMHSDELICQFLLNLKMFITKVTGVSFGTVDYMLQNLKMFPLTIKSWKLQFTHK